IAGGAVRKVNDELVAGGAVATFMFSNDGRHVVYLADQRIDSVFELFSVAFDNGRAESMPLAGPLPSAASVSEFAISPDGRRVVYLAGTAALSSDLYVVDINGGPQTRLSPQLGAGGHIWR